MDVLIGKQGNQPFPLTESSISRQHAFIHVDNASGKIILRDNNSTNGTWILSKDGSFKRITGDVLVKPETTIRLGASYICTVKKLIEKPQEPPVDITKLRDCYDTYMENKMSIEAKTSNIMMLRMISMSAGGLIGIGLSQLLPADFIGDETAGIIIKAVGTIIAIGIAWVIVDMMNKSLIARKKENEEYFKLNYCCPKCHYHFGSKVYTNLIAEGRCPNNNCKCKFTGK